MKKSASVCLTIVAAAAIATAGQRPDPCTASTFNEQACEAAVQNRGYCWNGRWVRMKFHYPYPYYYDAYQQFTASGGMVSALEVGSCGPPVRVISADGSSRAGFGSRGAGHGSAHC
jgi:hypothetical protein